MNKTLLIPLVYLKEVYMDYASKGITATPNIINWVEMPKSLGEPEYIELFKKSILLQNHSGLISKILALQSDLEKDAICFFNLDKILLKNNIPRYNEMAFVRKIAPLLSKLFEYRALVHTNIINDRFGDIFRSEGIAYIQKNLEDKRRAYSTILDMIRPYFSLNNKLLRAYLRITLEASDYKVQIMKHGKYIIPFEGKLKDISLNGVGIKLNRVYDVNFFDLKDVASVIVYIRHYLIQIKAGVITRVDPDTKEIGINFDINNKKMVGPMVADTISKLIYHYIEDMFLTA